MGVSHCRLIVAMSKLWSVMLVHKCLSGDMRVRGRSVAVGMMIFSIVGG